MSLQITSKRPTPEDLAAALAANTASTDPDVLGHAVLYYIGWQRGTYGGRYMQTFWIEPNGTRHDEDYYEPPRVVESTDDALAVLFAGQDNVTMWKDTETGKLLWFAAVNLPRFENSPPTDIWVGHGETLPLAIIRAWWDHEKRWNVGTKSATP